MVDGDEELKEADDRSSGAPDPEDEAEEDGYTLDRRTIAAILFAVDANDRDKLVDLMEPLHAADIADLLEQINAYDRRRLIQLYDREFDGEILSELGESIREEVIRALNPDVLADAVRELDSDDVVDLVEDLEEPQQEAILDVLEDSDRAAVEQALAYPEESAGRLMQREVVAVPEFWNVGQAIDYMRERDDLPEQFYHVILVDPRFKPVGHVTLGKLMASRRVTQLSDITEPGFRTFEATEDEGDIAYAFNQYHLISGPVVDENDRLVGVITIDDAMIVLDEEHDEDILRLAGVSEESALTDTVVDTTKRRFPWLAVNLVTAILASLVIAQFEDTIAQFVALAVLMPIVASMGGNAGTQTMTVAVRGIATQELSARNLLRVLNREVLVSFANGIVLAVLIGVTAALWFSSTGLGVVIGVAIIINMLFAGLSGLLIPIVLDQLEVDPAIASSVFVTTVTDVVGFFAFLGIAVLWFGLPF